MKNYETILKEIEKMEWPDITAAQTALAVYRAADGNEYGETEFAGLCKITQTIWDDMDDNPNLQIIAEVVCDCFFDKEWGNESGVPILNGKDFEYLSKDRENRIINAIYNRM